MREKATVVATKVNVHEKPGGKIVFTLKQGDSFEVVRREGPPQHKLVWFKGTDGDRGDFWIAERDAKGEPLITIWSDESFDVDEPKPPSNKPFWLVIGGMIAAVVGWLFYRH